MCGLLSEVTQRRLLTEQDLTLEKAYTGAHGMEAAKKKAGRLRTSAVMPSNSSMVQQYMQHHKKPLVVFTDKNQAH